MADTKDITTKPNEVNWIKTFISRLEDDLKTFDKKLRAKDGKNLPYSSEILTYDSSDEPKNMHSLKYETDILIYEQGIETWKPRIIIEGKINSVTTHDAITYSQKSQTHKNVHPFLRYGILLGNRQHYPLPGRLFRHGANFDFMLSWKEFNPDRKEWTILLDVIKDEFESSKKLEEIIFNSRSRDRKKFTVLHRPLRLK
ncbi:MAG: hypothetical protein AB7K37_11810 [Cyclobacteriaceae bacterium]